MRDDYWCSMMLRKVLRILSEWVEYRTFKRAQARALKNNKENDRNIYPLW
jgi:hypothetical protein